MNQEVDTIFVAKMLVSMLMAACPQDQKNLINTIHIDTNPDGSAFVGIGGHELLVFAKAPYAKFTNERPGIKYGAKSPFPGEDLHKWIDKCVEQCVTTVLASY